METGVSILCNELKAAELCIISFQIKAKEVPSL